MNQIQYMLIAGIAGLAVAYGICCGYVLAYGGTEIAMTKWAWRIFAGAGAFAAISFVVAFITFCIFSK